MARDRRVYSMSRRSFCWASVGIFIAPDIAIAQASKVRRIGVLEPGPPWSPQDERKQDEPLRELGWVEGQNLHIERRYDNNRHEALQSLAEELMRARVEIIVTAGTPATLAAKHATTTLPIVFRYAGAPVFTGLVASLARPGGNVTGFAGAGPEITTKSLSLLKELLPRLHRVGMLEPKGDPYARAGRQFEQVCRSLGLEPVSVEITPTSEIGAAIAELVREGAQALVVPNESPMAQRGIEIVDVATKHRLPTLSDGADLAREAGVLIAYSASPVEIDRIRAYYIDRILRGANPADLPVRQSTTFELVINLKSARALGLTIPKELLLRADEVIQ